MSQVSQKSRVALELDLASRYVAFYLGLHLDPVVASEVYTFNGPRHEKTCIRWFANNKGADQPAHPRSLISAFVIRLL